MAETHYIRLSCKLSPLQPGRDIAIALLGELGFESFEDSPEGVDAFIPESSFQRSAVNELFSVMMVDIEWSVEEERVEVENYNAVWESNFPMVEVEDKLLIRAEFHQPDPSFEHEIIIAPKMAFGTGHHETTWLIARDMFHAEWEGRSVLDMGCGTGVLAILAKKLGAGRTVAIDIDPWSTENTEENLGLNRIADVEVRLGDRSQIANDTFDRILANINRNILTADLPTYAAALNPQGEIWFSGFLKPDLAIMMSAIRDAGLEPVDTHEKGDWLMIRAQKPD